MIVHIVDERVLHLVENKSFINIHSRTMQWSGCYSHMGLLGY